MSWHVHISEHTFNVLTNLPPRARGYLFALFRKLEDDPEPHVAPLGEPDGIHYTATFGDQAQGMLAMTINRGNQRITPLQITWTDLG